MEITKPLAKLHHKYGDNGFTLDESATVIDFDALSFIEIYLSTGVLKETAGKYYLTQDGKNAIIGVDYG